MSQVWVRLVVVASVAAVLAAVQPLLPHGTFNLDAEQTPGLVSPLPVLDIEPDRWLDLVASGAPRPADAVRTLGDPPPPLLTADGTLQLHDRETGETIHFEAATNAGFAHRERLNLATANVERSASHLVYRSTAEGSDASTVHVLDLDTRERWSLEDLPDAGPYDDRVLAGRGSSNSATLVRFWDLRTGEPLGERDVSGAVEDGPQYRIPTTFGYSVQTVYPPTPDDPEADEAESAPAVTEHLLVADDFTWTLGVRGTLFLIALDAQRAIAFDVIDERWVINLISIPDGEVSLLARLDEGDSFPQFGDLRRPPDENAGRHLVWHSCGRDRAAWVYAADEDRLIRIEGADLFAAGRLGAWVAWPGGATALVDLDTFEYEFALPHVGQLSLDGRWLALPAARETRPTLLTCR